MKKVGYLVAALATLALLVLAGAWVWQLSLAPTLETSAPVASEVAVAPPAASTAAPGPPPVRYPVDSSADRPPPPAEADAAVLVGELVAPGLRRLFEWRDFARRVTATVDNLGRSHAPAALWPLQPAAGRFLFDAGGEATTIDADNAARYTPYVELLEQLDPPRAYAVYRRLYPQLQRAYQDLGFPGRYFNDRLVEVIDLLLATPVPDAPVRVHLLQVNGPYALQRPWVMYEFDNPAWSALTAGQRILLRIGPDNERRVQRRLAVWRQWLTQRGGSPAASAAAH